LLSALSDIRPCIFLFYFFIPIFKFEVYNFIALSFDNKPNSDDSKKAKNGELIYLSSFYLLFIFFLSSFYLLFNFFFLIFHRFLFENRTGHPLKNSGFHF